MFNSKIITYCKKHGKSLTITLILAPPLCLGINFGYLAYNGYNDKKKETFIERLKDGFDGFIVGVQLGFMFGIGFPITWSYIMIHAYRDKDRNKDK